MATEELSVRQQLSSWVNKYTPALVNWAYNKVSSRELAEDLVQETFVAAVQSIDHYEGRSNPKTWLFSILKNKIADHYRGVYKQAYVHAGEGDQVFFEQFFNAGESWQNAASPGEWHSSEDSLLDNESFRRVMEWCMKNLPQLWLSAVSLKYLSDMKGPQICEQLQISQANFWQILHRSKLQLRDCINEKWFTP